MSGERILISDPVAPVCAEILKRAGMDVDVRIGLPLADLKRALAGAVGLVVRSETKVTEEVLSSAPTLRVVGRAGTGVDNIDVTAATRRGVAVNASVMKL